jgi:prophage antirepressor-like protein
MPDLIPFEFESSAIRVYTDPDGQPWWIAKDVCDALGIKNNRQAISRLDSDEKGVISGDTPGGIQDISIVNEPGLYNLILSARTRSRIKPQIDRFKRWVTHEVIPSIRKTGKYAISDPLDSYPELRAIRDLAISTAEARLKAEQAEERAIRAEAKADMALDETHRMTIEEFVCRNGLLRQFPAHTWPAAARWLGRFCLEWNLKTDPVPTPWKSWKDEKRYPLQALHAWVHDATRKAGQLRITGIEEDGVHYGEDEPCCCLPCPRLRPPPPDPVVLVRPRPGVALRRDPGHLVQWGAAHPH